MQTGTAFTRAYCMGAQQGAVCVPSRAMLMSGRTLFRVSESLKNQTTWPEAFGQAGYSTFITGKWHNGGESVLRSFQQGRAVFLGGMGNPYKLPLQDISADRQFENKRFSSEHSVKLFADAAIGFLQNQKASQPFLCYVAFNCPHDPRVAPTPYHERYNTNKPPSPANFLRFTLSTTVPWSFATNSSRRGRAPKTSFANIWPTTMPMSSSWMTRLPASSRCSKPAVSSRTP